MNETVGPTVPSRSPKSAAFSDHQISQVAHSSCQAIARWAEATAKERRISVRRMPKQQVREFSIYRVTPQRIMRRYVAHSNSKEQ
ncbi:MAG: hypothetical protein JWQ49_304 [Edaphobacter sp.]|nr:hypothetical protein [Edaphobacter sp.]